MAEKAFKVSGEQEMPTGKRRVLIEMRVPRGAMGLAAMRQADQIDVPGLTIDHDYEPVEMVRAGREAAVAGESSYIVRGEVDDDKLEEIRKQPNVIKVWRDTPIAPFARSSTAANVQPVSSQSTCPIPPCDCQPWIPKGTLADVATYLKVDEIWDAGQKGDGIVIGIVDGGITAKDRPISSGDTNHPDWPMELVSRVTGGWPSTDWGTTGVAWGWHGNMCATDALGMAPHAKIYDLRISAGTNSNTISNALAAFQWAIEQFRADGTPQVLSNSWGIFQESWDSDYANDPDHPFTRKVVEALDEGILVLFAAGNCGETCPDGRCGSDTGPGQSIWGANGHQRVMTVGAVNKNEEFIGYSSQGPASLEQDKPDFCGISHFDGYFDSDSGTSAACPIVAGVVALIKQASPGATQDEIKECLKQTAKDIGPSGFDHHSGAGIIQGKAAFDCIGGGITAAGHG